MNRHAFAKTKPNQIIFQVGNKLKTTFKKKILSHISYSKDQTKNLWRTHLELKPLGFKKSSLIMKKLIRICHYCLKLFSQISVLYLEHSRDSISLKFMSNLQKKVKILLFGINTTVLIYLK